MATYHELKDFKDQISKIKKAIVNAKKNNEELLEEQESWMDKLEEIDTLLEDIKNQADDEMRGHDEDGSDDEDSDGLHEYEDED